MWGFSGIMKQIIYVKHKVVKSPNWSEANQLAILQAWSRICIRDYREQIQLRAVRAGRELGASGLQVQRSNHSATLPPVSCWTLLGWLFLYFSEKKYPVTQICSFLMSIPGYVLTTFSVANIPLLAKVLQKISVVSRYLHPQEWVFTVFNSSFRILRNCQLESDDCHLP